MLKVHVSKPQAMDEDIHCSEQQRLEQMLLAGIRSDRGMEIGSAEWKEYRERLGTLTNI